MYLYEQQALEKAEREKYLNKVMVNNVLHKEENPDKYVSLMSSMSHTYGNALAYIQNWVMGLFPENMFKTIHVNSKIAHRQLRSTPHEFIKKNKPMIIFRPRIPSFDEDRFLKGTPLAERQGDLYTTWGNTNLQPFFYDPKNKLQIKYQLNRTVFYVDVLIVLSTLMQQIDYYSYITNAVRINKPFMLNTIFESYLSEEMLSIVSDYVHVPLLDEHGNTKEFLDYMNGNSIYPITYKLQGSSRTREFYRYYPVNIDTIITDLDKNDGERNGNVMSDFQISFTIRMEFNTNGLYFVFGNNLFDMKLPTITDYNSADIIPIFTDVFQKEELNLQQGWQVYNRASCRLEDPNDSVELDQMFNMSIREAIKYHKENGLPLFDFLDIKVRRQGKPIYNKEDYELDLDNMMIRFVNQNTFYTYTIIVCINIEYINNLMKTLYNLK